MRFEKACKKDISALAALWQEAFCEQAEALIALLLEIGDGFCCRDGQALVAMLFALPYAVVTEGEHFDGRYLYGVATAQTYRGQGIASGLLRYAEDEVKKHGADGLLLVPADDDLRCFYEKRGFCNWSTVSECVDAAWDPCEEMDYLRLREGYLAGTVHTDPPEGLLKRCRFYKSENGCRAELFGQTAEVLPPTADGRPFAMAKALTERFPYDGIFSFAMDT